MYIYTHDIYIYIYVDETLIALDQRPRDKIKNVAQGAHEGPAHEGLAHKGLAHKGPGRPKRGQPIRARPIRARPRRAQ